MARKKKKDDTGLEPGADFVPTRLRPIDIQQKAFSTSMRGYYHPEEVDEFLDRLTADYAAVIEENKRLRDGGLLPGEGSADADAIIRKARADADEIIRRARTQAAATSQAATSQGGGGDAMAPVWPFLSQEREFLRSLASMVQDHAESIKRQVRDIQQEEKSVALAASSPSASAVERSEHIAEETGSAWTATAKPAAATPGAAPAPARDAPVVIPPSPVDTPAPAPTETSPVEEPAAKPEKAGEEPSLRELFWGDED